MENETNIVPNEVRFHSQHKGRDSGSLAHLGLIIFLEWLGKPEVVWLSLESELSRHLSSDSEDYLPPTAPWPPDPAADP